MAELPNAVVKRLLSKHGGGLRVSGSALSLVVEAAEGYIARLAQEAQASAEANKRKTVLDGDVEAARAKIRSVGFEAFRVLSALRFPLFECAGRATLYRIADCSGAGGGERWRRTPTSSARAGSAGTSRRGSTTC
jgi:histone H3/H4